MMTVSVFFGAGFGGAFALLSGAKAFLLVVTGASGFRFVTSVGFFAGTASSSNTVSLADIVRDKQPILT